MPCVLTDFQHIRPRHELKQEKIQDWIIETHVQASKDIKPQDLREELREKVKRLGLGKERIQNRGIQISDPLLQDWSKMEIYAVSEKPQGEGFSGKSQFFDREVSQIFERFYPEKVLLPEHLIHVTCTGYVAPSPAQKLISLRKAGMTTTVTHAYHMGCYAAIPAIRMGSGQFLSSLFSKIDIVHTEICSLHLHPLRHSLEQLLVQSLFGDGFIKYSIDSQDCDRPHLKIRALHEETIPDSTHCMTWHCEEHGLGMTLSKDIPVLIRRTIRGYLKRLCAIVGLNDEDLIPNALFAIHPGGPKILQQIQEHLNLEIAQITHSTEVLRDYGNMSSATLPHIWERMLLDVPKGTPIISLAFGPGLSIAGGLFEKG